MADNLRKESVTFVEGEPGGRVHGVIKHASLNLTMPGFVSALHNLETTMNARKRPDMSMNGGDKSTGVDLPEVTRLVEALENDLKKVREGSSDLDTLRSEVEQLRSLLQSPGSGQLELHEELHGIRLLLRRLENELVGDALTASEYIRRIGKMLGM